MTSRQTARREQLGLIALVGGGILIVAIVVVFAMLQANAPVAPSAPPVVTQGQFADSGLPLLGSPDAPVLLMEFSNFSCPGCAQYHPEIKRIIEKHVNSGAAALIFAPMVFNVGEDPSYIAAQAALCAEQQGKFWQMSDALFEIHTLRGSRSFTRANVTQAARDLSLDDAAFADCLASAEIPLAVRSAAAIFEAIGGQFTPSLIYSRDGGKSWNWFAQPDGRRYEAQVPLSAVDQVVGQR